MSGLALLVLVPGVGAQQAAPAKPPAAAPAPAATPAPAKTAAAPAKLKTPIVAVVDAQSIMDKSDASKAARTKIEAIMAEIQKQIDREQEALKAEEKALQQQQALLAADAYNKKRQEWQKKASDLEQKVNTARRDLAQARDGTGRMIQNALIEVVGKLAEERGVDIVLPTSQTLFAAASLNLTNEALTRLNKRLPEVPIDYKPK